MRNKKVLNFIFLFLFIIGLTQIVSAEQIIQQNKCVYLKQVCSNCTYANITSINYQNGQVLGNTPMTKIGVEFNYTFCNNNLMGPYNYNTVFDLNGVTNTESNNYQVTADGNTYRSFPSIYFLVLIGLTLLLFNKLYIAKLKTNILSILGGMILLISGVITLYPGFNYINYSNLEGLSLGLIFIGIGIAVLYRDLEDIF